MFWVTLGSCAKAGLGLSKSALINIIAIFGMQFSVTTDHLFNHMVDELSLYQVDTISNKPELDIAAVELGLDKVFYGEDNTEWFLGKYLVRSDNHDNIHIYNFPIDEYFYRITIISHDSKLKSIRFLSNDCPKSNKSHILKEAAVLHDVLLKKYGGNSKRINDLIPQSSFQSYTYANWTIGDNHEFDVYIKIHNIGNSIYIEGFIDSNIPEIVSREREKKYKEMTLQMKADSIERERIRLRREYEQKIEDAANSF